MFTDTTQLTNELHSEKAFVGQFIRPYTSAFTATTNITSLSRSTGHDENTIPEKQAIETGENLK